MKLNQNAEYKKWNKKNNIEFAQDFIDYNDSGVMENSMVKNIKDQDWEKQASEVKKDFYKYWSKDKKEAYDKYESMANSQIELDELKTKSVDGMSDKKLDLKELQERRDHINANKVSVALAIDDNESWASHEKFTALVDENHNNIKSKTKDIKSASKTNNMIERKEKLSQFAGKYRAQTKENILKNEKFQVMNSYVNTYATKKSEKLKEYINDKQDSKNSFDKSANLYRNKLSNNDVLKNLDGKENAKNIEKRGLRGLTSMENVKQPYAQALKNPKDFDEKLKEKRGTVKFKLTNRKQRKAMKNAEKISKRDQALLKKERKHNIKISKLQKKAGLISKEDLKNQKKFYNNSYQKSVALSKANEMNAYDNISGGNKMYIDLFQEKQVKIKSDLMDKEQALKEKEKQIKGIKRDIKSYNKVKFQSKFVETKISKAQTFDKMASLTSAKTGEYNKNIDELNKANDNKLNNQIDSTFKNENVLKNDNIKKENSNDLSLSNKEKERKEKEIKDQESTKIKDNSLSKKKENESEREKNNNENKNESEKLNKDLEDEREKKNKKKDTHQLGDEDVPPVKESFNYYENDYDMENNNKPKVVVVKKRRDQNER